MGGRTTNEHPLLRTLVVCGASLVGLGCGARTESGAESDGGRATVAGAAAQPGGAAATVSCPQQCSSPAQFTCDDLSARANCRCDSNAPLSADQCESIWDFSCKLGTTGTDCAPSAALLLSLSCECSTQRLRPEHCPSTAQFTCSVYQPVAEGCRCDPSAPAGPEDCPDWLEYSCYDHNAEIGCRCIEIARIR
jgi:hypothetical protein